MGAHLPQRRVLLRRQPLQSRARRLRRQWRLPLRRLLTLLIQILLPPALVLASQQRALAPRVLLLPLGQEPLNQVSLPVLLATASASPYNQRNAKGTSGQISAQDIQLDSEYLCPVQIGTPAQTMMLDFDTGSSDLWVNPGSACMLISWS